MDLLGTDTSGFDYTEPEMPASEPTASQDTGGQRMTGDPLDMWADATNYAKSRIETPMFQTRSYDPKTKERYAGDPSIYNDYFDPEADNERVAAENWTKWDAVSAGLGGFKENFKSAYLEAAYTWPRMGKALLTMDSKYLAPSEAERAEIDMKQQEMQEKYPIFYEPGTQDDFLTKGFLAESIQNLGFTFGTLGELATEWGITTAVAAGLTATGAGAPAAGAVVAAEATSTAAKFGKIWKSLTGIFKANAVDDAARLAAGERVIAGEASAKLGTTGLETSAMASNTTADISRTMAVESNIGLNGVKTGVDVWDNALRIASKVPFVGQVADAGRLIRTAKAGELGATELMKIGAGGLRRSFAEWQMAASEASIEAGSNYGEIVRDLTKEYKLKNNGEDPTGADLDEIRNLAMQSSTSNYATNVAILAISNKLMFGNLFGKFMPDSKAVAALRMRLGQDLAAGTLVVQSGKKIVGYQKNLLGTFGLIPKIADDFGKRRAAWEFGKSMMRGVTKFEVSEGIQENLQEGTNEFLKDYYTDIYRGDVADWGKSWHEAVDSQVSKRGMKTFLMGAMTGMFVSPVVNTVQYAAATTGINPNLKSHRESVARSLEAMNQFFKKPENILNESVKQIKLQNMYNEGMIEGLTLSDRYQYHNNKDSAFIQMILHAKRTGMMTYVDGFLKGYGQFSEQEFQTAFTYTPQELGASSPSEVMNNIANTAKRFSDVYDKYQTKFGLYMNMDEFIKDPVAKQKFGIKKAALLDHITKVAFAEAKGQQAKSRQADILRRASSYESIGNSLGSSWNTITDPEEMSNQIFLLTDEIKLLESGEKTKESEEIIKLKKEELVLVKQIQFFLASESVVEDKNAPEGQRVKTLWQVNQGIKNSPAYKKGMADLISRYLEIKNEQSKIKTPVSREDVLSAMDDIIDYMALGRDHAEYIEAVNYLNDPETMGAQLEKLMDARAGAHARIIHETYEKLGSISEVAKKWLEEDEQKKTMEEILEFSKRPAGTYSNYMILQKLLDKLKVKKDEFESGKKATEEEINKQKQASLAKSTQSLELKPVALLYDDPNTRAEAEEYMAMRYDVDSIKNSFAFDSTDPSQRIVYRYYIDENGVKVRFEKQGFIGVRVPISAEIPIYDETGEPTVDENNDIVVEEVKLDTFQKVMTYLREHETRLFQSGSTQQTANPAAVAATQTLVNNEASKLINHVGSAVVVGGVQGTLQIQNDEFVVAFDDGSVSVLSPVGEDVTFDDFQDVSIAHTKQPATNQGIISNSPLAKVDVQESGTATIEMSSSNLEQVKINDVLWNIERNAQGEITGFTRIREKKKGKTTKKILERMSSNSPLVKDYIKRVEQFLMMVAPVPQTIEEAAQELEALDSAIMEASLANEAMEMRKLRSDELFAQYRINAIVRDSKTNEISFLIHQWANPETRSEMSNDDMLKLFMWASDLRNKIKGNFKIFIGNRAIEGILTELNLEYINPISEIIDEDGKLSTKPKRATKRSSKKKDGTEQPAEAPKARKGKRDTSELQEEPGGKKPKPRSVKTAVDAIYNKSDKKASKRNAKTESAPGAESIQKAPLGPGATIIRAMAAARVSALRESIETGDKQTKLPFDFENPFDNLKQACDV